MNVNHILIAIVVGLLVALIATGVMRASLKSVSKQYSAGYYVKEEGLRLTRNKDVFMYKRTERFAKPKQQQQGPGQQQRPGQQHRPPQQPPRR